MSINSMEIMLHLRHSDGWNAARNPFGGRFRVVRQGKSSRFDLGNRDTSFHRQKDRGRGVVVDGWPSIHPNIDLEVT